MNKITHHNTQESSLEQFQESMSHHCAWGGGGGREEELLFGFLMSFNCSYY